MSARAQRLARLEAVQAARLAPMPELVVYPEGEDISKPGARVRRIQLYPKAPPPLPPARRREP